MNGLGAKASGLLQQQPLFVFNRTAGAFWFNTALEQVGHGCCSVPVYGSTVFPRDCVNPAAGRACIQRSPPPLCPVRRALPPPALASHRPALPTANVGPAPPLPCLQSAHYESAFWFAGWLLGQGLLNHAPCCIPLPALLYCQLLQQVGAAGPGPSWGGCVQRARLGSLGGTYPCLP